MPRVEKKQKPSTREPYNRYTRSSTRDTMLSMAFLYTGCLPTRATQMLRSCQTNFLHSHVDEEAKCHISKSGTDCFGQPVERVEICQSASVSHFSVALEKPAKSVKRQVPSGTSKRTGTPKKPSSCLSIHCLRFSCLKSFLQKSCACLHDGCK